MNKTKQKNILIILFMILLLVFVGLICYIFIYAKNNPVKTYLDPDTIEVKALTTKDYVYTGGSIEYMPVTESTKFKLSKSEEEINLIVENGKLRKQDLEVEIKILLENNDINNDIKLIYQTDKDSIIFTNTGKLYRLLDTVITEDNSIEVTEILTDVNVQNISQISYSVEGIYVITDDNRVININTLEEYRGISKLLEGATGTLTLYTDETFSLGDEKIFIDNTGNDVKFNIWFENVLISENNKIYEIDFSTKTLRTSKLDSLLNVAYNKNEEGIYDIIMETTTGVYEYTSNYYYQG